MRPTVGEDVQVGSIKGKIISVSEIPADPYESEGSGIMGWIFGPTRQELDERQHFLRLKENTELTAKIWHLLQELYGDEGGAENKVIIKGLRAEDFVLGSYKLMDAVMANHLQNAMDLLKAQLARRDADTETDVEPEPEPKPQIFTPPLQLPGDTSEAQNDDSCLIM